MAGCRAGGTAGAVRGGGLPGLLALRSASGLGLPAGAGGPAPTAFNRAGEKAGWPGQLPRVVAEVVLNDVAGSLPLSPGGRFRAPARVRAVSAGQAACAGVGAVPEATAG